jgi:hypothetical protein
MKVVVIKKYSIHDSSGFSGLIINLDAAIHPFQAGYGEMSGKLDAQLCIETFIEGSSEYSKRDVYKSI